MSADAPVTRGAMHIHTRRSFDSLAGPEAIVTEARRRKLDFICVCDHDDLTGALAVRAAADRMAGPGRLAVLVGAEYRSDAGDLICLGIETPIATRRPDALLAETHRQGGLVLLPHPYRGHHNVERLAGMVDLIETVNVRCTARENRKAAALARRHAKPVVCGTDAHMIHQIRHCTIEFDGRWDLTRPEPVRTMLLTAPRRIHLRRRFDPAAVAFCQLTGAIRWDGLISRIRKGIFLRAYPDHPSSARGRAKRRLARPKREAIQGKESSTDENAASRRCSRPKPEG